MKHKHTDSEARLVKLVREIIIEPEDSLNTGRRLDPRNTHYFIIQQEQSALKEMWPESKILTNEDTYPQYFVVVIITEKNTQYAWDMIFSQIGVFDVQEEVQWHGDFSAEVQVSRNTPRYSVWKVSRGEAEEWKYKASKFKP